MSPAHRRNPRLSAEFANFRAEIRRFNHAIDRQPISVDGSQAMTALRVLVVEDDALIGMLMADVLTGMGHQVCAVEATEAGAIAAAARCKPELMVVDAQLREGDGITAVEKILRNGFIPHVFVSGAVAGIQAQRPDAIVIQKPFQDTDLARAIARALAANLSAGLPGKTI